MPVADSTSHSLINNGNNGKSPSPTFPSFLPLEIFDNTEYDCRTPTEWVGLGKPLLVRVIITERMFNILSKPCKPT